MYSNFVNSDSKQMWSVSAITDLIREAMEEAVHKIVTGVQEQAALFEKQVQARMERMQEQHKRDIESVRAEMHNANQMLTRSSENLGKRVGSMERTITDLLNTVQQATTAMESEKERQQQHGPATGPARLAPAREGVTLVDEKSLILAGVSHEYSLMEVEDVMKKFNEKWARIPGVQIQVEVVSGLEAFKRTMGREGPAGGGGSAGNKDADMPAADGAPSSFTTMGPKALRRVVVQFNGSQDNVTAARSALIDSAYYIKKVFQWTVCDNLTPAGRAARRAAAITFRQLLEGGFRPKWRNGAEIFVWPPAEVRPRPYTEADLQLCAAGGPVGM